MRRGLVTSLLGIVFVTITVFVATVASGGRPLLGLDLQGGSSVVLSPVGRVREGTLNQAISIIRNRVDALGVAEPDITLQGDNIVVELAGIKNQQRALELVGTTAELRFRPVIKTVAPPPSAPKAAPGATTTTTTAAPPTDCSTSQASAFRLSRAAEDKADRAVVLRESKTGARYCLGPALLTGNVVRSARSAVNPQTGEWSVSITFTGEGSKQWDEVALANVGKQLAIVLDGDVKSAPTINQPENGTFAGSAEITGNFTERETRDLALVLRYGSLPVELKQESVRTVSATLGQESLRAGLIAGLVGLGLVLLYIIAYYRALGIVVVIGLALSSMLLWSIVCFLGDTSGLSLSLSGITGIIVSVGVTVDSYVVYFERLKDDVRAGRSVRASSERSFNRAFKTILTANLSSFLGAIVLWWLTVGSVRGFAFFLGLSTLLDLVVALAFTRPMVVWLSRSRVFTEMRGLGVARGLARADSGAPA